VARFLSTAGGAVRRGRRRLRLLLAGLSFFLLAAALAAFVSGRAGPGVLALLALLVPGLAWRTASDHETLWLDVEPGALEIRMRWRRRRVPLAGAVVRRLALEEIPELERLATLGGITAGSGGFESRRLGEIELYASDLGHAVLLEAGEERLIVTPDEVDAFVAAVRAGPAPGDAAMPRL
jgi:hypothetical protein